MAGSLNMVQLIGHLGADPEVRSFAGGGAAPGFGGQTRRVANLRLATSESWTDKATGEKRERTEWHQISITNDGLVGVVEKWCRKGSKIYAEGQLRTRKWQDRDGNDRYTTEVSIGGFNGRILLLGDAGGGDGAPARQAPPLAPSPQPGPDDDFDDDVPF
jgi:single-strand DNA-binding protein